MSFVEGRSNWGRGLSDDDGKEDDDDDDDDDDSDTFNVCASSLFILGGINVRFGKYMPFTLRSSSSSLS